MRTLLRYTMHNRMRTRPHNINFTDSIWLPTWKYRARVSEGVSCDILCSGLSHGPWDTVPFLEEEKHVEQTGWSHNDFVLPMLLSIASWCMLGASSLFTDFSCLGRTLCLVAQCPICIGYPRQHVFPASNRFGQHFALALNTLANHSFLCWIFP
jgi:hypothetical protein